MAKCEKILIAGFSGAGKSSLLREIAQDTPFGWDHFDDLDTLIAKKYKMEIHQLIEKEGLEKFRVIEHQILADWLKGDDFAVLALGGGSLTRDVFASINLMKTVRMVHLSAA